MPPLGYSLRLNALDGVEHFEGEVVAASGKYADGIADQVVRNDGRDSGGESSSSGDERFRDAGGHRAQSSATGSSEAVESVDDTPHGTEQPDERGNSSGDGKPRDVTLQACDFFGGADLHSALNGSQASESGCRGS